MQKTDLSKIFFVMKNEVPQNKCFHCVQGESVI